MDNYIKLNETSDKIDTFKSNFLNDFEIAINNNSIQEFLEGSISDFIRNLLESNNQLDLLNKYLVLSTEIREELNNYELQNDEILLIEEIVEILNCMKNSIESNQQINLNRFFDQYGNFIKNSYKLKFFISVNKQIIKKILIDQSIILTIETLSNYMLILEGIINTIIVNDLKFFNELKQFKIDYSNYLKNVFESKFNLTQSKNINKADNIEVFSLYFISNWFDKSIDEFVAISILNAINELVSNSNNLKIIFYNDYNKIFSTIHYLGMFDLITNIIYNNISDNNELLNLIIKTKLILLRALAHNSGISYNECLEKSQYLVKFSIQILKIPNDDILQIIESTPWKNLELDKTINNIDYIKEVSHLYGLFSETEQNTYGISNNKLNNLDIGISFYCYGPNEKGLMNKITELIKIKFGKKVD